MTALRPVRAGVLFALLCLVVPGSPTAIVRTPPGELLASVLRHFPPPDAEVYRRKEYILRVSNATGLPGNKNPCDPNTFLTAPDIPPLYIREVHHFALGRPWMMGREYYEWALHTLHVEPGETVLEYGCGALSTGVWLIELLQEGHYFGMEPEPWLLDAGRLYEVPLHLLGRKRPTLVPDGGITPAMEVFGDTTFDRIFALTAFHHLEPDLPRRRRMIAAFAPRLRPEGRIYVTGELPVPPEDILAAGLRVLTAGTHRCRWVACEFPWYELAAL